jgi:hypothetical protein
MPSSTTLFSNNRKVQRARPLGGLEQAKAISLASFSPSKIRATAGVHARTKPFEAQTLVAELAVEALGDAILQGLPGSINAVPMPCVTIHDSSASDTNSGPLHKRIRMNNFDALITRRI